jgi:hypothetical protein
VDRPECRHAEIELLRRNVLCPETEAILRSSWSAPLRRCLHSTPSRRALAAGSHGQSLEHILRVIRRRTRVVGAFPDSQWLCTWPPPD